MKRLFTSLLFSCLVAMPLLADDSGFVGDGYYRVRNYASQRYIYMTDNTGSYDENRDVGDFAAIQLWRSRDYVCDPASVIYVQNVGGNQYDLQGQGTGLHKLVSYYVTLNRKFNDPYEVYATKAGMTKYLSDNNTSKDRDRGTFGTAGNNTPAGYRYWSANLITTDHATNYFGIRPTITVGGKHYQPFYAGFPFSTASAGMHVYYISIVDTEFGVAVLKEVEGTVPACTPVIIECSSTDPSNNRLNLLTTAKAAPTDNLLRGTFFANDERLNSKDAFVPFKEQTMRVLSVSDKGELCYATAGGTSLVQLYTDPYDDNYEHPELCIAANHSYLAVPATAAKTLRILTEEEYRQQDVTAVKGDARMDVIPGVFTLNGSKVSDGSTTDGLPAGLYIVNGHKVVVK